MNVYSYRVNHGTWHCKTCNRDFNSAQAIFAHLSMSQLHVWCSMCDRHFTSPNGYTAHKRTSKDHNYCEICDYEADDWEGLCQHWSEKKCYFFCQSCTIAYMDQGTFRQHSRLVHPHRCQTCGTVGIGASGLRQHESAKHGTGQATRVTSSSNQPPPKAASAPTLTHPSQSGGQAESGAPQTTPRTILPLPRRAQNGSRQTSLQPIVPPQSVSQTQTETPTTGPPPNGPRPIFSLQSITQAQNDPLETTPTRTIIFRYLVAVEYIGGQPGWRAYFQSITATPGLETFSFEELRLARTLQVTLPAKNFSQIPCGFPSVVKSESQQRTQEADSQEDSSEDTQSIASAKDSKSPRVEMEQTHISDDTTALDPSSSTPGTKDTPLFATEDDFGGDIQSVAGASEPITHQDLNSTETSVPKDFLDGIVPLLTTPVLTPMPRSSTSTTPQSANSKIRSETLSKELPINAKNSDSGSPAGVSHDIDATSHAQPPAQESVHAVPRHGIGPPLVILAEWQNRFESLFDRIRRSAQKPALD